VRRGAVASFACRAPENKEDLTQEMAVVGSKIIANYFDTFEDIQTRNLAMEVLKWTPEMGPGA